MSGTDPRAEFRLDRAALRLAFDRASGAYESAAVLQARVRAELLERLELVRLDPAVVLDLGAGTGLAARELKRRYRAARVIALDIAPGMLREARRHSRPFRRFARVCADAYRLPLPAASIDLIYSNLMLQWCDDLDRALAEIRRVLKPGGFLALSTFGPDTLRELRAAWLAADSGLHVSAFLDMHDIGEALARAGLAEPVLDTERFALTYPDARALARDLKSIGAHNVMAARARGLTGKGKWRAMAQAYEALRRDGTLPATYEVIYGAAWGTPSGARAAHAGSETHIAPGAIRRRVRGTATERAHGCARPAAPER